MWSVEVGACGRGWGAWWLGVVGGLPVLAGGRLALICGLPVLASGG